MPNLAEMEEDSRNWAERLTALQTSTKGQLVFALAAVLLIAGSLPLIAQLGLNSAWTALLPEDRQSVQDLQRIGDRVGGLSTLTLGVQSKDLNALQHFAKDFIPKLEALASKDLGVRSVDYSVTTYERFVADNKYLYADLKDLEEVQYALEDKLDHELAKNNPLYVSLDDGDGEVKSFDEVVEPLKKREQESRIAMEKFAGGYYVHEDGDFLAIFIRSDLKGGDAGGTSRLIDAIKSELEKIDTKKYADDLRVDFGGSLVVALEEQTAIVEELVIATVATLVLVLLAIFLFFRRVRAVPLLALALLTPVAVTFACAEVFVDYLNTSTAFLGSIVIGNGVNPNIIWLARYFEERRAGADLARAISRTHRGTWVATFVASTAAALAYGSLMITDFRGFRDFGIIGSIGMELCWIGSLVLLPVWVALFERIRPMRFAEAAAAQRNIYGRAFSYLALRAPKPVVALSVLTGIASVVAVFYAIANDPMEYDFRKLKSVREGTTVARQVNRRVGEIMSGAGEGNAIAMILESPEDARRIEAEMEAHAAKAKEPVSYGKVRSLDDLLPKEQEKKLPVLEEIREVALKLRKYASDDEKAEIDKYLPPEDIELLTYADLPEPVARSFTERDGTRGRLLFVEKEKDANIWNGRFLVQWAEELRTFKTEDGQSPPLAGRGPIFGDIVDEVWESTPRSILASLLATMVLLAFAFRKFAHKALALVTLLLGIAWMGASMILLGQRINFLNVLAFPITFGNGADYGVNVLHRFVSSRVRSETKDVQLAHPVSPASHAHHREPGRAGDGVETKNTDVDERIRIAVEESGGAVVLCSLTTIIAYGSLYLSANQAINSFGLAMSISEVTCVAAAMLTLPAILKLRTTGEAGSAHEVS